jgi:hypothetical protein
MVKYFWAKIETEYLGFICRNGHVRTSPGKLVTVKDWPLLETQKQVMSFAAFCYCCRKFIHRFADCLDPLTDFRQKSLPGKVAHVFTRAAYETLKVRMIFAPVFLIPKSSKDAKFIVATDSSKVGIAEVLL